MIFYFLFAKIKNNLRQTEKTGRGFSLIELMVSVSILTIISIMVFASYPEFSQRMAIRRTSNDIALAAREAQVNALSIKEFGGEFPAFGVNFNKGKTFTIFADLNTNPELSGFGNGIYDGSLETFKAILITTGDSVSRIQLCKNEDCFESTVANIVYPRTNPMASITDQDGFNTYDYAIITITAPNGKISKNIEIWLNGQISIK